MGTNQARASERFEQFKLDYEFDAMDEFRWEQKFQLEDELRGIPINETKRRRDVVALMNDIEGRCRAPKLRHKYKEKRIYVIGNGDTVVCDNGIYGVIHSRYADDPIEFVREKISKMNSGKHDTQLVVIFEDDEFAHEFYDLTESISPVSSRRLNVDLSEGLMTKYSGTYLVSNKKVIGECK